MKGEAFAGLLMVAILAGAAVGYLAGSANGHSVTSVTTATAGPPSFVNGLQLVVSVEPSNLTQGQNVTIRAWVYNPTPAKLTVTWPQMENPSQWPCGTGEETIVDVYAGHYGFSNLTAASPLLQWNASIIPGCPYLGPGRATFLQFGENASEQTTVLGGYYASAATQNGAPHYLFQPFPQGAYTVVVTAAWGQQQLDYFEVT